MLKLFFTKTGKGYNDWDMNADDGQVYVPSEASYQSVVKAVSKESGSKTVLLASMGVASILMLVGFSRSKLK